MKILVVNAGSSSLKYQVIDMKNEEMLGKGIVERIGSSGSSLVQNKNGVKTVISQKLNNHTDAFKLVMSALTNKEYGLIKNINEIKAIGHRVVHSAEDFNKSVVVNDEVLKICEANAILAPLHQPANIACIKSCMSLLDVPNVAVFDTVFHATMPKYAYMYAVEYNDYLKHKVRRYGFHGTSHKFASEEAIKYLKLDNTKIITCHLGNGSSIAAVKNGLCVDTSMGLTPLEGLIMGTRSGDLDPALVVFLAEQKGISCTEVINYLNKKCGFLGLSGVSDFRDLEDKATKDKDVLAILAMDMFQYRIKKYIGAYAAAMNGLDCIVFTGGIGENAWYARKRIIEGLEYLGIDFDYEKNAASEKGVFIELNKPSSKVKILAVPANEELVIARETLQEISNS